MGRPIVLLLVLRIVAVLALDVADKAGRKLLLAEEPTEGPDGTLLGSLNRELSQNLGQGSLRLLVALLRGWRGRWRLVWLPRRHRQIDRYSRWTDL